MEISMDMVKQLRDETNVAIMQCKKALEDAGGDMEKARIALRKKSAEIATKKADRTLGSGVVAAYIHGNSTVGAMVELNCETDFVAKNEDFKQLAYDIAMHIAAVAPKYRVEEDIPESDRAKAIEFFKEEVDKQMAGKPEEIKQKALDGKISAFFAEQVVMKQPYVKNPDITIAQLIEGAVQKFGEKTELARFSRFVVGK
ncbi:MAG TPA: elongation factor Ts [Candidatus Paceibacterota bacterium]|nr:elongation factor Ts [Candidatus Paceibacterota bacterium]